jgi:hypothetical protein
MNIYERNRPFMERTIYNIYVAGYKIMVGNLPPAVVRIIWFFFPIPKPPTEKMGPYIEPEVFLRY